MEVGLEPTVGINPHYIQSVTTCQFVYSTVVPIRVELISNGPKPFVLPLHHRTII